MKCDVLLNLWTDSIYTAEAWKIQLDGELLQIEKEFGVPRFDPGVIVHSRRSEDSWIHYLKYGFDSSKSATPYYQPAQSVIKSYKSKELLLKQEVDLYPKR